MNRARILLVNPSTITPPAGALENVGVAIASMAHGLAMWDRLVFGSLKVNA